jgi:hypothetical protein
MQIGPGEGPEIYRPLACDNIVSMHSEFWWDHYDLCRVHQMYYAQYRQHDEAIEKLAKKHGAPTDENLDDAGEYLQSKIRESMYAREMELKRTSTFIDQLLVIGLWASVEQYSGRVLEELERRVPNVPTQRPPHEWDKKKERFTKVGLDLERCKSYSDANECRTLNNNIKHDRLIGKKLEKFSAFAGLTGQKLDAVPLQLQRYVDGVFEFVGHLMESADSIASDKPAS